MRGYYSCKITYKLKCSIINYHILYKTTYNKFEQKTKIEYDITRKILICIIKQVLCENIYTILISIRNLDRFDLIL